MTLRMEMCLEEPDQTQQPTRPKHTESCLENVFMEFRLQRSASALVQVLGFMDFNLMKFTQAHAL